MLHELTNQLRPAIVLFALLTILTGMIYPFAVTGVAALAFPDQATGSLILQDGKAIGSRLIGQQFNDPKYFWGRPSATSPNPYNAASSGGSNLGPTHPTLESAVKDRIAALQAADPSQKTAPPIDLVTTSASGLDPHLSPAAAYYQVSRVARTRGLSENQVRELVAQYTDRRTFGLLGEPRVNVLLLNLALDNDHQK